MTDIQSIQELCVLVNDIRNVDHETALMNGISAIEDLMHIKAIVECCEEVLNNPNSQFTQEQAMIVAYERIRDIVKFE